MGWFWGWQSTPVDASTPQTSPPTCSPPQRVPSFSSEVVPNNPMSPLKHTPTAEELAEAELRSIFEELEAESKHSSSKGSRVLEHPPTTDKLTARPSNLSLEDEILPIEMSCRQAFDAAFYCQSLGGQFNNLYRYGGIRSCSQHWNDFWFCMRMKSYSAEQKEAIIRAHYKKKSLKYKLGPSSEDVWELRDKKLEWGEAFSEPVEAYVGSDEEWNRLERMRREGKKESA